LGWRAYRSGDVDGGEPRLELAIFCPFCAPLEFDWPLN
jgi:hypothetical protein